MKNGWFVGSFKPTLINTSDVEVAVKSYKKDDYEECHFHKVATEITVVISGKVKMNGSKYMAGDIVIINPSEVTDFTALEDTVCVVVKHPGSSDDKYLGEPG